MSAREATFSCAIDLKIGQNVCLDKISDVFKYGSPGHYVKLKKYLVIALEATFLAQLT